MKRSLMDDITKIAKGHFDFDDDLDDILDGKKKKKKKKAKDKKKKTSNADTKFSAYKESLKSLSKKELRAKLDALGISIPSWELEDKKAMRKAIASAVKKEVNINASSKSIDHDDFPGGGHLTLVASSDGNSATKKGDKVKDKPTCYFDEDSRDFVITDAMDRADIDIFNSMRTLGKLRQHVRTDDGFGELMDRISAKLMAADTSKLNGEEIIDVDYTVIDEPATEEQAALPASSDTNDAVNKKGKKK